MITNGALDDSLAPFADPWQVVAEEAMVLLPPRRIKVSEAAARFRQVHSAVYQGPWSNEVAPYMVEPMDATSDGSIEGVVFCGPAQSLKTDALVINKLVHSVTCVPLDTRIVHMDELSARRFGKNRLERLKRESPEFTARLSRMRGHDNIGYKQFLGMTLTVVHPTVNNLSSDPIPQILLTDYDRMSDDIDGEGSAFGLARQRTKTFGSKGMVVAESSPGRDLMDPVWTPQTPHEAPPVGGILGLYNMGDRRRWYWPCPQCGEFFEPTFDRLNWSGRDGGDTPVAIDVAVRSVAMVCPDCGSLIDQASRRAMNAKGVWLREGEKIRADGTRYGAPVVSSIASFWLRGPAAAFQDWPRMVESYLRGLDDLERTGEEGNLKVTVNTDQAEPYMPAVVMDKKADGPLTPEVLRGQAEDYPLQIVPEKAVFLVMAVDGQAHRFVVQTSAFGPGMEHWLIDRFDVVRPPDGSDRLLDPARMFEDWVALETALFRRAYRMAGHPGKVMRPRMIVYDSNGPSGYTTKAYNFWRKHRKEHGQRLMCLRGVPGYAVAHVALTFPDSFRKDRNAGARGEIPVLQMAVDRLKDLVDAGLRRKEDGADRIHLSRHLPPEVFDELCAEFRGDKGWERRAKRNEALDLTGYAIGAARYLGAHAVDWDKPQENWPVWAQLTGNACIDDVPDPGEQTTEGVVHMEEGTMKSDVKARADRMLARMMGKKDA